MIHGIVGGRTYRALHLVRDYVMALPVGDYGGASSPPVVVSGHAAGVDIVAEITAHQRGLQTVIFPARGASRTEFTKAAFARNTEIAQRSDELDAFVNSESRGTWDTVQKARLFGKVVRVHEEPAEHALLFHTAIHPNTRQAPRGYRGPSMLDITRGSGREGLPFAPSEALLSEARRANFDWYEPRYVEEMRQSWKKNRAACRRFFTDYGSLVTVDENGRQRSVFWDEHAVPPFFQPAVWALRGHVERDRYVSGAFFYSKGEGDALGIPENVGTCRPEAAPSSLSDHPSAAPAAATTRTWHHLAVQVGQANVRTRPEWYTSHQMSAMVREEYSMVLAALHEFDLSAAQAAHHILTVARPSGWEKHEGVAKWFLSLHEKRRDIKDSRRRANYTWLAVATAPKGFAHIKSGVFGSVLEGVVMGASPTRIAKDYEAKMHPLLYQRAQTAPADGQVDEAEKIIEKMGVRGALARRFATVDDVMPHALWRPSPPTGPKSGVFGHLRQSKTPSGVALSTRPMTWEKFAREALPGTTRVELRVPSSGGFGALVTAIDPAAPPILQWDREDARNPVSWYFYHPSSMAERWGLTARAWTDVTAIVLAPNMWGDRPQLHHGKKAFFLLKGARDLVYKNGGLFFPNQLRSELHGIRSTMESFSNAGSIAVPVGPVPLACGYAFSDGKDVPVSVRVTSAGGTAEYTIDRWD